MSSKKRTIDYNKKHHLVQTFTRLKILLLLINRIVRFIKLDNSLKENFTKFTTLGTAEIHRRIARVFDLIFDTPKRNVEPANPPYERDRYENEWSESINNPTRG